MLEGLQPNKRVRPCRVREVLSGLEKKDQEILTQALLSPDWQSKALSRELTRRGVLISDNPISRHRKGECSCSTT
jgi:hypothetical protein